MTWQEDEELAKEFSKDTGFLAAFKDKPVACGNDPHYEHTLRQQEWDKWLKQWCGLVASAEGKRMTELIERDINIRLAKHFLGVKKVYYGDWDTDKLFPMYIPSGKPWRTHQIDAMRIPYFTQFLNVWITTGIIPKLAKLGYVVTIGSYECSGYYALAYHFMDPEPEPIKDDNPALALSLAVDKLIDILPRPRC